MCSREMKVNRALAHIRRRKYIENAMQLYKSTALFPLGTGFRQGEVFTFAESIKRSPEVEHKCFYCKERKWHLCFYLHLVSEKLLVWPS